MEEVLELFGRTAFKEREFKGGETKKANLPAMTPECWVAWQKYRSHEHEVKAIRATIWRFGNAVVLDGPLLPNPIMFDLLDDEEHVVFCKILEYIKQYQLHGQTVPRDLVLAE